MADYGLKVSKDGYSTTSSNPEDYVFSSKFSTVKIVREGSGTATIAGSGSTTTTIRHDLGFIPLVDLYFEPTPSSGKWRFGAAYMDTDDTYIDPGTIFSPNTYVDNLYLVFTFTNRTGANKSVKYYYFIYSDPI